MGLISCNAILRFLLHLLCYTRPYSVSYVLYSDLVWPLALAWSGMEHWESNSLCFSQLLGLGPASILVLDPLSPRLLIPWASLKPLLGFLKVAASASGLFAARSELLTLTANAQGPSVPISRFLCCAASNVFWCWCHCWCCFANFCCLQLGTEFSSLPLVFPFFSFSSNFPSLLLALLLGCPQFLFGLELFLKGQ